MRKLSVLLVLIFFIGCSISKQKENQAAEANAEVVVLSKADFKEKVFDFENSLDWDYRGDKPCIIDFYADWCGPCKKVSPILADLANVYKGELIVYKVNVDDEEELASVFGIQSIPSLLFIPVHGEPKMSVGALGRNELVSRIEEIIVQN